MNNKMILAAICIFLCAVIVISTICGRPNYDPEWIVGKTAEEIQSKYGKFDSTLDKIWSDGYHERSGYYVLPAWHKYEEGAKLKIAFDENWIAKSAWVVPGGAGG